MENTTTIDVDAIYENGVLRLKQPVDLPENAEVHVTIQADTEARTPLATGCASFAPRS